MPIAERQKGRVDYRCHTRACLTTSIREDTIEDSFNGLLDMLDLSEEALNKLVAKVGEWVDSKIKESVNVQRHDALIAELDEKLETLTDALLDRLIDKETYTERREKLLLEKQRVEEDAQKVRDFLAAPDDVRKFLELIKTPAGLYQSMKPAEKRAFLKFATSNRYVRGKNLDLQPREPRK